MYIFKISKIFNINHTDFSIINEKIILKFNPIFFYSTTVIGSCVVGCQHEIRRATNFLVRSLYTYGHFIFCRHLFNDLVNDLIYSVC